MPTEAELKRLVVQSLRNARRVYRTADTAGEVLERWMDRKLERKTRITRTQAEPVIALWEDYRGKVLQLERALADFLSTAAV